MAKHLTLEERDRIAHLNSRGFAQAAIAKALGRSPSVISRELRRNRADDGTYYGGAAQRRTAQRRAERPLERKMDRWEQHVRRLRFQQVRCPYLGCRNVVM